MIFGAPDFQSADSLWTGAPRSEMQLSSAGKLRPHLQNYGRRHQGVDAVMLKPSIIWW